MIGDGPDTRAPAQTGLHDVRPCLRDPLFGLLKDRLGLSPRDTALVFLAVYLVGNFLGAWVSGTAFPREGLALCFVEDKVSWVLFGFLIPAGAYLAMRLFRQIETTFERVRSQGTVLAPLGEYNAFLRQTDARYNSPVLHVGALAAGLAVLAYTEAVHQLNGEADWLDLGMGFGGIYQITVGLVAWYAVHVVLFKVVLTALAINRVFTWPVDVQPMHPDGCGGFRLFTEMALTIAFFAAVLGTSGALVVLTDTLLRGRPPATGPALGIVVLDAAVPLMFVSCLYRAHQEMKAARSDLLEQLHVRFQGSFRRLRGRLADGAALGGEDAQDVLHLVQLQDMIARMPVWPTNTQIIAQVAASVALPLGLLIVQVFLERALGGGP